MVLKPFVIYVGMLWGVKPDVGEPVWTVWGFLDHDAGAVVSGVFICKNMDYHDILCKEVPNNRDDRTSLIK